MNDGINTCFVTYHRLAFLEPKKDAQCARFWPHEFAAAKVDAPLKKDILYDATLRDPAVIYHLSFYLGLAVQSPDKIARAQARALLVSSEHFVEMVAVFEEGHKARSIFIKRRSLCRNLLK